METSYETAMDNFVKNSSTNEQIKANNIEMASLLERMRVLSNNNNILIKIAELEYQQCSFQFEIKEAHIGHYIPDVAHCITAKNTIIIANIEDEIKSLKDLLK